MPHGDSLYLEVGRAPPESNDTVVVQNTTHWQIYEPFVDATRVPLGIPWPVPGGAFVTGGAGMATLFFLPDTGQARILWTAEEGRVLRGHALDKSAANEVVWVDCDDTTPKCSDYKLWASPAAKAQAEMIPRLVAKTPDVSYLWLAANKGLAIVTTTADEARLVRLSDGRGWDIPRDPAFRYTQPIWVDDEFIWLVASTNTKFPFNAPDSLVRIARSTLPPEPPVPSGL
ncbi:hypothetical protein EON82_26645 [bacterium]|nr:MAG: hypothetical protein EON82_26645 [bacterium]